ncbi:MAG: hypothetical protein AB7I59_13795 [Geminicoccaceae bacterium]
MGLRIVGTALMLACCAGAASAAPLAADRAGSCVLPGGTAGGLKLALAFANSDQSLGLDIRNVVIDSIVIRSAALPNGGQPLTAGGHTGAIVCTFNRLQISPQTPYAITPTTASAAINGVDLLASQIDTWIQYSSNPAGPTENLFCLSTGNNDDCFKVAPASGGF